MTGASTGIGEATVRALRAEGWTVFAVARRAERLAALEAETGAVAIPADIAEDDDVARLLAEVTAAGGIDTLDQHCRRRPRRGPRGGRQHRGLGVDVPGQRPGHHETHPRVPADAPGQRRGNRPEPDVHGRAGSLRGRCRLQRGQVRPARPDQALRLEEAENNIRVIEVAPGLVHTEEFALNRLGDEQAAEKVYQGVEKPLTAADVADVVRYAVSAPHHVNLDQIVIRPVAQAANHKLIRKG